MGCTAECFLGYLPILRTTQKSKQNIPFRVCFAYHDAVDRVLIAAIRDMGVCPCPRCLIPKSYFWRIGLSADMSARVSRVRQYLRDKITAARDAIYKLGIPIKGAAAERLLKEFSLVPTFVSPFHLDS